MKRRFYLDVLSAFEAGFSTAFDDFSWPIPQRTYDSIARAFVDFLEASLADPSLSEGERFDLALSIVPIADESFYYTSSHMIVDACKRNGWEYVFSPSATYYPVIAEYREGRTQSVHDSLLNLKRSQSPGFVARHARSNRERLRRYGITLKSKLNRPHIYQMTTNKLKNEWTSPGHASLRSLVPKAGWGLENSKQQHPSTDLANHIAQNFTEIIAAHEFGTDDLLLEYIRRISTTHLLIASNWRNKNHEKYFNTRDSILLTATAGGFESRLMSHVFQRNDLPVIRFTHGGERGLIDDPRWHYPELMFTDYYLVHGRTEASQVNDAVIRKTSSFTSRNLKVIGVGSRFHTGLRQRDSISTYSTQVRNVMVVSASFHNEFCSALSSTQEEIIYLEWHLRLLKSLQSTDYNVISKRHPRGRLTSMKLFGGYVDQELMGGSFTDLMTTADAFIFDFAASAFMEALCTNKPVVLIDPPHSPFLPSGRKEVEEICTIVCAEFDENNRVIADFDAIIRGLEKPVDPDMRQAFVENYLLNPSDNLIEFTDLIDR